MTATVSTDVRFRSLRGGGWGGVVATIAIHGALVGAIYVGHRAQPAHQDGPRDVITTELVKLGKPREKFWLPRIVQPTRAKAPEPSLKLSENANAAPAPKEAPRPEDPEVSKDLKRALARARMLRAAADEPEEGLLTGSAEGTSNEAHQGDEYATAVVAAIKKNWSTPTGMVDDAQLGSLKARVRVTIGDDGTLGSPQVLKSSGNALFDDSCLDAIKMTGKVPPPSSADQKRFARGLAIEFDGKNLQ